MTNYKVKNTGKVAFGSWIYRILVAGVEVCEVYKTSSTGWATFKIGSSEPITIEPTRKKAVDQFLQYYLDQAVIEADLKDQVQKNELAEALEASETLVVDDQFFNDLNRKLNADQKSLVAVIESTYNIKLHENGIAETTFTDQSNNVFSSEIAPLSAEEFANTPIQRARKIIEENDIYSVLVDQEMIFNDQGLESCTIYINIKTYDDFHCQIIEVNKNNNVSQCEIIGKAVYDQICKYFSEARVQTRIIEKNEKPPINDLLKFHELERRKDWKKAVLVFTQESFSRNFSLEARSYEIFSDCKYFDSNMGGSSLYGYCLDGSDQGVRLDKYMYYENWEVEYCYIIE